MRHAAAAAFLLSACLLASPAAAETLYLTAAHMIDPVSGKTIDKPAIVIDGKLIAAVGTAGGLAVPEGARTLDLGGRTILPGRIGTGSRRSR